METLTKMPLFNMLNEQNEQPTKKDLTASYIEFTQKTIEICTERPEKIPVYFILNYAHSELIALQEEYKNGIKKK